MNVKSLIIRCLGFTIAVRATIAMSNVHGDTIMEQLPYIVPYAMLFGIGWAMTEYRRDA